MFSSRETDEDPEDIFIESDFNHQLGAIGEMISLLKGQLVNILEENKDIEEKVQAIVDENKALWKRVEELEADNRKMRKQLEQVEKDANDIRDNLSDDVIQLVGDMIYNK